jgi:hypothetical protein
VTSVPPKCSFSSTMVANASGTPTLTVTTAAAVASAKSKRIALFYAVLLPFCGLLTFVAGLSSRGKKHLAGVAGCVMLLCLIWLAACGGGSSTTNGGNNGGQNPGSPGTTVGNYTVTVTATSGTLTQTSTLSMTVQ